MNNDITKPASKIKKQHFVPRFYLSAWCIPDSQKIYVYDKEIERVRINNIGDVAERNYFYDTVLNEILPESFFYSLSSHGIICDREENSQAIEGILSKYVESPSSPIIKNLVRKVERITNWEITNCFFVSEEEKEILSVYFVYQFLRVNAIRTNLKRNKDHFIQSLKDMGFSNEVIQRSPISKISEKKEHLKLLVNDSLIPGLVNCFRKYIWVLSVNRTEKELYTSDNPIITVSHDHLPKELHYRSDALMSYGVELRIPLSPRCILSMYDPRFHYTLLSTDRRYVVIDNPDLIDFCNINCFFKAEREIYSVENNFKYLINKIRTDLEE